MLIMIFRSRKFYVWLISLTAVSGAYLLFTWMSDTPRIDTKGQFARPISQANIPGIDTNLGQIGEAKVGTVQKAVYRTKDRVFGFEKLLHESGDQWLIEKPYMSIFKSNFTCHITSNEGTVQVETVAGKASPKDALLSGNVTIHILPEGHSNIKESFIWLDDVIFNSEKSQFSTAGPVEFVCQDAQMVGTGMELVYNDQLNRLEFFQIVDLEYLHLKNLPKTDFFSPVDMPAGIDQPPVNNQRKVRKFSGTAAVAENSQIRSGNVGPSKQELNQYYKCVFNKNVVIEYGRRLVFTDGLAINNILWFGGSSTKPESLLADNTQTTNAAEHVSHKQISQTQQAQSTTETVDAIITCDEGIVITPMETVTYAGGLESLQEKELSVKPVQNYGQWQPTSKNHEDAADKDILRCKKINHDASTRDTVAVGPVEVTFYADTLGEAKIASDTALVKITAQKQARFLSQSNQIVFEGNCVATMFEDGPSHEDRRYVYGQKIIATLSKKAWDQRTNSSMATAKGIKHLTITGGGVKLASTKTVGQTLLGGIELKCSQIDYDADKAVVYAAGPGLIKIDNANASISENGLKKLSLERPCYALMDKFEKLQWFIRDNRVVADADSHSIHISYLPIVDGHFGQVVSIDTPHIEAGFIETAAGHNELSTLTAAGGIYYKEQDAVEFTGSELFYDGRKSLITVDGSIDRRCLLNGVFVDFIKYDLVTSKVNTQIAQPGALSVEEAK